ncbi:L-serine ammonia-lyase [Pedomonas sp. V897]|uniref:L-serine ammonia-lyase n=1 Tax=Pedomonas sp. V897 TaxID=3446482 RepID=UPI003EE08EFD
MFLSLFDVFKVGVGPSSSHTVGPMLAAARFVTGFRERGLLNAVERVQVELFGSLALTGLGHATDRAVLLGLEGNLPHVIDPEIIEPAVARIRAEQRLRLAGEKPVPFDPRADLVLECEVRLPYHVNGMRFTAYGAGGREAAREIFYSVGGGFVVSEEEAGRNALIEDSVAVPYQFDTAAELLALGEQHNLAIADLVMANEMVTRSRAEVEAGIDALWATMDACISRGCREEGVLPGGLKVPRRAPALYRKLLERQERSLRDPMTVMDWVNLWAMAVNEENAAGGRVVTAPTNGAAGIIPAVLRYYDRFCNSTPEGIRIFLLTAAAIAALFKRNASISGAEVGCQGEVGVACSMAAAGLTAALGGTNAQIENAAEIGMEHNLGLTCDPVGGLVQIPCIERNAMGAIKAIDASRLALLGDGSHVVPLDKVIETMRQTGLDMSAKYKETSQGGLAVNMAEC